MALIEHQHAKAIAPALQVDVGRIVRGDGQRLEVIVTAAALSFTKMLAEVFATRFGAFVTRGNADVPTAPVPLVAVRVLPAERIVEAA